MAITTCMTNQAKMDLFSGSMVIMLSNVQTGNCFAAPNTLVNALTNTYPLRVGMKVTFTNQNAANTTWIQRIINSTAIELSEPATGAAQQSMTFAGDTLNIALIKFTGQAGTYDRITSCYANIVTTSDEVVGTGYTAGGLALTVAAVPDVPDSNTAIINFSPNPSWTSATINAAGCMIYNTQARSGMTGANATTAGVLAGIGTNSALHAISLHDFGGAQQVTSGTFTVNMPTANGTAAILRIA